MPLKWRSLFKDIIGFGWDMYLTASTAGPPSDKAGDGKAAGGECAPEDGEDAEGEETKSSPPAAAEGGAAKEDAPTLANPVVPFTAIMMAVMYWGDKAGYAKSK